MSSRAVICGFSYGPLTSRRLNSQNISYTKWRTQDPLFKVKDKEILM